MSVSFYITLCLWKNEGATSRNCPAGAALFNENAEDSFRGSSGMDVSLCWLGVAPELSNSSSRDVSWDAYKIKCYLPPRVGNRTPTSPGRIGNESARISRAKETRRSVTSLWQISALETARHGCTAAPCPSAALAVKVLKHMSIYCFPKHCGNGKEKRGE